MVKNLIIFIFSSIFCLLYSSFLLNVYAFDYSLPNNKFGIHLAQPQPQDIKAAAELVNSSGGDWGYITLVIQEDDRSKNKWQGIFDDLRDRHLIPIIRLATKPEGENWRRPKKDEADDWANFLDSLNWVVKNRYVILFNEPNHGSEWGSEVDAEDYIEVAKNFARKLKDKNPDFFIMMAGLDASAPESPPVFEDEGVFLTEVFNKISAGEFEKLFNGWTSHSYPNPGFSGKPGDIGRRTIRTYQWELEYLKKFTIDNNLPVFITETGWTDDKFNRDTVATYFETAYQNFWLPDDRVIAVTPFVLDYQGSPFLGFSWKKLGNQDYYQQYYSVQLMEKIKGRPERVEKGELVISLPTELVVNSVYYFPFKVRNLGQTIWDKEEGYILKLDDNAIGNNSFTDLKKIKPFSETDIDLYLKTGESPGKKSVKISLYRDDQKLVTADGWNVEVVPLPGLTFKVGLFPKLKTDDKGFEIQIFDAGENLVYKKTGLNVANGQGVIEDIKNVVLKTKYRLVVLKDYYLPRQVFISFKRGQNIVFFKKMLPLDFNKDGRLSFGDILSLIRHPFRIKEFWIR